MKPSLATAFRHEMEAARTAWRAGDPDAAFGFLERAHILGQRHLWPHVLTHLWMLRVGWRRRDGREIFGQVARLFATLPGALLGWVPAGNTGGANVSALRPMPIPAEFAHHFAGYSMRRSVTRRLTVLVIVGVLALAGLVGAMEWHRAVLDRELKSGTARRAAPSLTDEAHGLATIKFASCT